jgi:hypothetical protein
VTPPRRPLLLDAALLLLLFAAYRAVLTAAGGPSWIPYWDEYDFLHMAGRLYETGTFVRSPETSSLAVVPTYWGVLFARMAGMSADTLRLSVQALAYAGAVALDVWLLGRGLGRWTRLIVIGAVFAGPLTVGLMNAYTSDVMFVALQAVSLMLLITGLVGGRLLWLALGSGAAVLAFGAREIAAAILPGILTGLWLGRAGPRAYFAAGGALVLALLVYLALGFHARSGGGAEHIWGALRQTTRAPLSPRDGLSRLVPQVAYLSVHMLEATALNLVPVAVLVARGLPAAVSTRAGNPRGARVVRAVLVVASAVLAAVDLLRLAGRGAPWWQLGQMVGVPLVPQDLWGVPGLSGALWPAVVLLADVSLVVLLGGLAAAAVGRGTRLPALTLVVAALATVLVMALVDSVISRYAVALLAPLAMALPFAIRRPLVGRRTLLAASGFLVTLFAASLVVYRDYRVTTAALWADAGGLRDAGVPARSIYAGYEYLGAQGVFSERAAAMQPGESWNEVLMRIDAPYVVAVGALPAGYEEVDARQLDVLPGIRRTIVVGHARP